METSAGNLVYSAVEKFIAAPLEDFNFRNRRAWIVRPEFNSSCLEVFKILGKKESEIYQPLRPEFCAFKAQGYEVSTELATGTLDFALVVPTRQRSESLALLAHALLSLTEDGKLLFACANTQGAGGFLSRIKEIYPDLEAESLRKCRLALLPCPPPDTHATLRHWIEEASPMQVPGTSFWSLPGIYGWNKIDRASELLISTLDPLKGAGADLGAGYGYLSHQILSQSPELLKLHAVEADLRALDCARKNLDAWKDRCDFHWLDVTTPEIQVLGAELDWVVMNPPFHQGAQVESDLGRAFIESAASLLRPEGRLFMVANAFLGYEELLMKKFRKVSRVLDQEGFKVIHAIR
jgi:16S rRNA (guanine1207-N2)-methyltransferase